MSTIVGRLSRLLATCLIVAALCGMIAVQAAPTPASPPVDLTTGRDPSPAAPPPAVPAQRPLAGGRVLWDLTHGVYIDYQPSGSYSGLVAQLAAAGFTVETTSAGLNNVPLADYDIVVVNLGSNWDSAYIPDEVSAVTAFVQAGGGLLLLGDNPMCPNANINPMGAEFGTAFGLSEAGDTIATLPLHPILGGVSTLTLATPGEISAAVPSETVAWDADTKPVANVAAAGDGQIVAIGDINLWDNNHLSIPDNALFAGNVFAWLLPRELDVAPSAFHFTAHPRQVATDLLLLANTGGGNLDWAVSAAVGGTDVLGDWSVFYDWGCGGYPGWAVNTYNVDYTFTTSQGEQGTWSQIDNQVTWAFDNGTTYTGYVAGTSMAGTQVSYSSSTGCWEASRVLVQPTGAQAAGGLTASGEPAAPADGSGPLDLTRGAPAAARPGPAARPAAARLTASGDPAGPIDLTRGTPVQAMPAARPPAAPQPQALAGGRVLWDLTHGVYLDYQPSGSYSDLVALLASAGLTVETTDAGLNNVPLADYDIVVISLGSNWDGVYTPDEIAAVTTFVQGGGGLLLMGDNPYCPNANINPVSAEYGITFGGAVPGDAITSWIYHPIFFPAVGGITLGYSGGLATVPPSTAVAWDPGDLIVTAVAAGGAGRVAAIGDINLWDNNTLGTSSNRWFAVDVLTWLARSWLSATPEMGRLVGYDMTQPVIAVDGSGYVRGEYGLLIVHTSDNEDEAVVAIPVYVDLRYPVYLPIALRHWSP